VGGGKTTESGITGWVMYNTTNAESNQCMPSCCEFFPAFFLREHNSYLHHRVIYSTHINYNYWQWHIEETLPKINIWSQHRSIKIHLQKTRSTTTISQHTCLARSRSRRQSERWLELVELLYTLHIKLNVTIHIFKLSRFKHSIRTKNK